jgi:hypothetical protein
MEDRRSGRSCRSGSAVRWPGRALRRSRPPGLARLPARAGLAVRQPAIPTRPQPESVPQPRGSLRAVPQAGALPRGLPGFRPGRALVEIGDEISASSIPTDSRTAVPGGLAPARPPAPGVGLRWPGGGRGSTPRLGEREGRRATSASPLERLEIERDHAAEAVARRCMRAPR